MDLLIDVGNTNLRWTAATRTALPGPNTTPALGEVHTLRHHGALPLDLIAAWDGLPTPRQILVGNVGGPELAAHLIRAVRSLWGAAPSFAVPLANAFGVRVAYADPTRLGADRWLALIGAHRHVPGPVLIVDAGTAITYDLLLGDGSHLGGLILPGVHLLRETLLRRTRIRPIDGESETGPDAPFDTVDGTASWATNTTAAIAGASLQAPAAMAERLYGRMRDRAGVDPQLLLTGGDGPDLAPLIDVPARILPDLVLQGLALLA
jgi:type III pantothenate kinase